MTTPKSLEREALEEINKILYPGTEETMSFEEWEKKCQKVFLRSPLTEVRIYLYKGLPVWIPPEFRLTKKESFQLLVDLHQEAMNAVWRNPELYCPRALFYHFCPEFGGEVSIFGHQMATAVRDSTPSEEKLAWHKLGYVMAYLIKYMFYHRRFPPELEDPVTLLKRGLPLYLNFQPPRALAPPSGPEEQVQELERAFREENERMGSPVFLLVDEWLQGGEKPSEGLPSSENAIGARSLKWYLSGIQLQRDWVEKRALEVANVILLYLNSFLDSLGSYREEVEEEILVPRLVLRAYSKEGQAKGTEYVFSIRDREFVPPSRKGYELGSANLARKKKVLRERRQRMYRAMKMIQETEMGTKEPEGTSE